jgi:integrase
MTPKRTIVKEFGLRNHRRVLVVKYATGTIQVERYVDAGRPRRKNFPTLAGAVAWARAWYDAGETHGADLTLRQLFDRFFGSVPSQRKHRGSTILNAQAHRRRLEQVLGPDFRVNRLTLAHLDGAWQTLLDAGVAPNQVAAKLRLLKRVLAWGHSRELVTHSKAAGWDVPEGKALVIAEYSAEEAGKILAQWDYQQDGWQWRPWAVAMIASSHGFRLNAILHLRWEDVDLAAGTIRLRAETDKTKRDWDRPLTWEALSALRTARYHADRLDKESPWVFYGKGDRPYTRSAALAALVKAEAKAEVPHLRYRGFHGFRRGVVNDVRQRTGDAALALLWVGDRDIRQAKSYVRERPAEMAAIADHTGIVPPTKTPRGGVRGGQD